MSSPSTTENAIGTIFRAALQHHPDTCFLRTPSAAVSYAGFYRRCCVLAHYLDELPGQRLACHEADSPALVLLLLSAALSNKTLLLFNVDQGAAQVREQMDALAVDLLIADAGELEQNAQAGAAAVPASVEHCGDSELLILTSGTTGAPKCARYRWSDLVAQVTKSPASTSQVWLLAYRLNHFAGIQMLLHTLANGHTLVLAESSRVGAAVQAIAQMGVTHISSTPTFWRYALAALDPGPLPLRQITLGSEAVSGELLKDLQRRFPQARVVHIFATTELGSCVSVSDGRPGLPVSVLSRRSDAAVRVRVVEDELEVKAKHGMQGYVATQDTGVLGDGWRATGDLVAIEGDRIVFKGRRSEIINVGGVKVHPQEVEAVVNAVRGVKLARAFAQKNPVVGQIVAVDVVCMEDCSEQEVEDSIYAACLQLSRHSRPRQLNFVEFLNTNNFKLERR